MAKSDDPWCCPPCFKQAFPFHNCSSISNNWFPSDNSSIPDPENSQTYPSISSHSRQYCSIMYCNCRSLTPKLDTLRVQAAASSPDIIALTETWLDPSISSSEIFIPGYISIRRDRNWRGGGILLYLKDSIPFRNTTCHDSIELVFTEVQLKHGKILLGLYYRPPSAPRPFSELESALASIPKLH